MTVVYRQMRTDMRLDPVPPTGRRDAWLRTHRMVRQLGSGVLHAIKINTDVAYVTKCGLTLSKDVSLRCKGRPSTCCTDKRKGPPVGLTDPREP